MRSKVEAEFPEYASMLGVVSCLQSLIAYDALQYNGYIQLSVTFLYCILYLQTKKRKKVSSADDDDEKMYSHAASDGDKCSDKEDGESSTRKEKKSKKSTSSQ